jgi:ATP-grasp domain
LQKVHLAAHDVPLPEFMSVPDLAAAKDAGLRFGYPYMLKNRKLAYDGKGIESELPFPRSEYFILSISSLFLPTHHFT